MRNEVILGEIFKKEFKKLSKKYRSLKSDVYQLIDSLEIEAVQGVKIRENTYKIRIAIKSKGKGKSGGGRVLTFVSFVDEKSSIISLLTIYDKSEKENVSDKYLDGLIDDAKQQIIDEEE